MIGIALIVSPDNAGSETPPIHGVRLFNLIEYLKLHRWGVELQETRLGIDRLILIERGSWPSAEQEAATVNAVTLKQPGSIARLDWRDIDAYLEAIDRGEAPDASVLLERVRGAADATLQELIAPTGNAAPAIAGPLAEPLHIVERDREHVQLTVQDHEFQETLLGRTPSHSDLPIALSSEGDLAVAWSGSSLLLWRDGTEATERDHVFATASGLQESSIRIIAVRALFTTMIQIVAGDASGLVSLIRAPDGTWGSLTPLPRNELVSGAFLGRRILAASASGDPRWLLGKGEALPLPARFGGLDALALDTHDVIAVWGTGSDGALTGEVLARPLTGKATWTPMHRFSGVIRLGLVRDTATPTVSAGQVTAFAQLADGSLSAPTALPLPRSA